MPDPTLSGPRTPQERLTTHARDLRNKATRTHDPAEHRRLSGSADQIERALSHVRQRREERLAAVEHDG